MVKHAVVIVGFLTTPAFGVVIDDFSDGAITLVMDTDNRWIEEQQMGLNPDAVIGGRRHIRLVMNAPHSEGYQTVATVDTATQTFHLNVDANMENWSMQWGANFFDNPDLALNADLLSDGANAFSIDVAANLVYTSQSLGLGSGTNEETWQMDATVVAFPASDTPYSVRIPFSRFSDVNLHDVDYVAFGGGGMLGCDLTLGAIRTVPEPSTLVTLILGLIGIMRIAPPRGYRQHCRVCQARPNGAV